METNANIELQNYGLYLNERKKKGVDYITIDEYIKLLDYYIELIQMLDNSRDRFSQVMQLLGIE